MKGLILSGGKGTRLYPLTYTRAKQLIPVANKPVLVRVIEAIRDAGVTDIGIVVGDTAPQIQEALTARKDLGVNLEYIFQPSPDGLAHAVKISHDFLGDDRFVMFLGDNVIQGGISNLIRQFAQSDWNSQIVLKRVGMEKAPLYGIAQLRDDGGIEKLIEKPKTLISHLALVGLYYISNADALKKCLTTLVEKDIRTNGELQLTDALQMMIDDGEKFTTFPVDGWYDCGKPETLLSTNQFLLNEKSSDISIPTVIINQPVFIAETAIIENSVIGPFATIGENVKISESIIKNSIVGAQAEVSKSLLENSIVGRHSLINGSFKRLNTGDSTELDFY